MSVTRRRNPLRRIMMHILELRMFIHRCGVTLCSPKVRSYARDVRTEPAHEIPDTYGVLADDKNARAYQPGQGTQLYVEYKAELDARWRSLNYVHARKTPGEEDVGRCRGRRT